MNKNRLECEMRERGISVDRLCAEIGVSRSAYYRKCSGKSEFTLAEIRKIMKFLRLDNQVMTEIFLQRKYPKGN